VSEEDRIWREGDPEWTWPEGESVPRYKWCQFPKKEVVELLNAHGDFKIKVDDQKEKELLTQIAYCAEGMFDCEDHQNIGDAGDWKRKLKNHTDEYYNYLFNKTGEQH